jgi:glycerophosphoryl diester phosphodiesterase
VLGIGPLHLVGCGPMTPFDAAARPAIMGHRGSPWRASENTPHSFALAAAEGATWVELDARLSGDGQVVVHHDAQRADGTALIDRSAAELRAEGVHLLADVLDGLPDGLGVDVECKNLPGDPDFDEEERLAAAVVELLRPRVDSRPLLTSSFNPMTVEALAAGLPDVIAGLLYVGVLAVPDAVEIAAEVGARAVCPHVDVPIDADDVAAAHAAGCAVLVWTVDLAERARELADAGVDALCTNDPAGLIAALGRG